MTRFFFVKARTLGAFVPSKYQYVARQPMRIGSGQPAKISNNDSFPKSYHSALQSLVLELMAVGNYLLP
jgi:hypothetical protein